MKHLDVKKDSLFLLKLDIDKKQIYIRQYKNDEQGTKQATEEYSKEEEKYRDDENCDVVLVGAENLKDLKKAYPNYIVDTDEFIQHLQSVLNKY